MRNCNRTECTFPYRGCAVRACDFKSIKMDKTFNKESSYILDFLLVKKEEGDQDALELYLKAEEYVFGLLDIWEITKNWENFKELKKNKETGELIRNGQDSVTKE